MARLITDGPPPPGRDAAVSPGPSAAHVAEPVRALAHALPDTRLPAYIHDTGGLARHMAAVSAALGCGAFGRGAPPGAGSPATAARADAASPRTNATPSRADTTPPRADATPSRTAAPTPPRIELYYAAKANPAAEVLRALAPHVHGIEVASGGELAHVRRAVPGLPIAFGGPGKTDDELDAAVAGGVHRLHIESEHELHRAAALARAHGRTVDLLLRANPPVDVPGGPAAVPLAMGGRAGPFGMDPDVLDRCARLVADEPRLRLHGIHAHLASGLDAAALALLAEHLLDWALGWARRNHLDLWELTLGGGMAVDYHHPERLFDWSAYGTALAATAARPDAPVLRIEPGRALTAYHGWYVTDVLDVKYSRGEAFAVVRGGTHHLRTPAARGHSQPLAVLPRDSWPHPWPRPGVRGEPVTFVGQLCTPKDVLAARVPLPGGVRAGDRIAFAMAGAYAWNISHRDFLMHPPPTFHYVSDDGTHLEQAAPSP